MTPRYEEVLLLGPERLRLPAGSAAEPLRLMAPDAAGGAGPYSSCGVLLTHTPRSRVPAAANWVLRATQLPAALHSLLSPAAPHCVGPAGAQ